MRALLAATARNRVRALVGGLAWLAVATSALGQFETIIDTTRTAAGDLCSTGNFVLVTGIHTGEQWTCSSLASGMILRGLIDAACEPLRSYTDTTFRVMRGGWDTSGVGMGAVRDYYTRDPEQTGAGGLAPINTVGGGQAESNKPTAWIMSRNANMHPNVGGTVRERVSIPSGLWDDLNPATQKSLMQNGKKGVHRVSGTVVHQLRFTE